MPYKSEKIIIAHTKYDRRIKLTNDDKFKIKQEYDTTSISIGELARKYNVSRRTIDFILYPDKKEENLKRRKERGGEKIYYKKERHREYIKKHRTYKQEIYKNAHQKKELNQEF